ncbi:capsular polysaccharide synthesis protein [Enterococcus olivae]
MNKSLFSKKNIQQLKTYFRTGQIFYFFSFLLLNGFDKNSLELGRIGAQNKLYKKFRRKYKKILNNENSVPINFSKYDDKQIIWFCWFQGLEDAPVVVKKCYESIQKFGGCPVVVITDENYHKYTNLPDYIIRKYKENTITKTHFSDILRLDLLSRHGGIWIDSTVLLTERISQSIMDSELFFFQKCKPGKDGSSVFISNWFLVSKANNKIILKTKELIFNYWKNENQIVDYFFFHIFFSLVCEKYQEEYNAVNKLDNSAPHYLLLELQEKFSDTRYKEILNKTGIHKLTYKLDDSIINDDQNLFNYIF